MGELRLPTEGALPTGNAGGPDHEPAPGSFDGYRLVRSLGEGGIGEVWLAEQLDPVRRKVALKIIKSGMDTKEVVARFEYERQALALMEHGAIARVFDAGKTPEGRPYFVMEYVDGVSITEHCDRRRLSTTARLELLAAVCDGVQHAHQKAVIHRDLKPSNILVAIDEGKAQPKVIDFGIAKAIGYRLSERTLFTEQGVVIGTPEYMSPEQADWTGQDVDTRTDVYSLGVILYELLSGELPFASKELRASSKEDLRHILRERDPILPSQRLRALAGNAGEIAEARSTDPRSLARELADDLDAITLKAIEKERGRRYGTATELAEDIRRYLRHEPVLARPPSRGYRARKYVRRHRMGVSITAGLAVLLIMFAMTTALQAARVARERDRANREAAVASNVSGFLTRMFEINDPSEARGNSVTAREILDRASGELETGVRWEPVLQGRMMETIGVVYENLGLFDRAASMLEKALAIRRRVLGTDHPDTLRTAAELGQVLSRAGRHLEAEPLLLDTVSRSEHVNGPRHPDTLVAMNSLASLRFFQGDLEEAERLDRRILDGRRELLGPGHPETLSAQTNLGMVLSKEGRDEDAVVMLRDALDRYRQVRGPEHPETLNAMNNLGLALRTSGRPLEAEMLLRQLLEISTRVLGPEHPDTLGAMGNLANTLMNQNRAPEAEPLYRRVLEIERRVLGPDHQNTFLAISGVASALGAQGQLREAEALNQELLAAERRVLGPEHRRTGLTEYDLACLAARTGRTREALELLRQSLAHHLPAQTARLIGDDADFLSLHGNPEFEALAAQARLR